MFNKIEVQKLIDFTEKLSKSINPMTNEKIQNDNILSNKIFSKYFSESSEVLRNLLKIIDYIPPRITNNKCPFSITEEAKNRIGISEDAISISALTYIINSESSMPNMEKLHATDITSWLTYNGFLSEVQSADGKIIKVVTEKAKAIGISRITKTNSNGIDYEVNVYDKNAQQFILDNLDDII